MTGVNNGECQLIINEVQNYIAHHANSKDIKLLQAFAQRYYTATAVEDLRTRSTEELYNILYSHWKFMNNRVPNEAKIRIFNPTKEKDGWHSSHTVIQISHDDIPFLVDSARMVINHYGYQIHFIIHFGGFKVKRDAHQHIVEILPPGMLDEKTTSDAPIYIEIDRLTDEKAMLDLENDINRVLGDVRLSVADWRKMVDRVETCLAELGNNPPDLNPAEIAESRDFLRWLINNNFIFLGARDYKLIGNETNRALQIVPGSGLGVLRDESLSATSKSYAELPPQARKMALSKKHFNYREN